MLADKQTLGEKLKELRQSKGYSMRALAEKAKLRSAAFIADMEKGFRYPSPEVLTNLANALEIPIKDLKNLDRRAPIQEIKELTAQTPAWADVFRKIVDDAKSGGLTPTALDNLLTGRSSSSAQDSLPLWK